jgi:hypothetical protein
MGSSGAFNVQLDQLRQHAGTVADLAADTRTAAQTAQASLSGEAFGVIGQFLATALLDATGEAKDALADAAQTVSEVNTGLMTSAAVYQEADQRQARVLGATGQEVR